MAIKNFKPYSTPPPVLLKQEFWNKDEPIVVHNKFGQRQIKETKEELEFDLDKIKQEQKEEIKIVQTIEEPKPRQHSENIIDVWCLPCLNYNESVDPLYNERSAIVDYGDKFIFKAKIINSEDLYIRFIAQQKIPEYSVIYPKNNDRRWWRVRDVQEMEKAYIIVGVISDYQPSFVD